eukprot:1397816-Amphidinium_carterae.1
MQRALQPMKISTIAPSAQSLRVMHHARCAGQGKYAPSDSLVDLCLQMVFDETISRISYSPWQKCSSRTLE